MNKTNEQSVRLGHDLFWDMCEALQAKVYQKYMWDKIYALLVKKYSRPRRFYHILNHPLDCIAVGETVKESIENWPVMQLAIWFHDAEDTEIASVKLLASWREDLGLLRPVVQAAEELIMCTVHPSKTKISDGQLISDIDLFVGLGGTPEEFKRNGKLIRQEHIRKSDETFYRARLDFFSQLTAEPIYQHAAFRKFASRTQANIAAECRRMKALLNSKI